jgi:tetratricopeptide (TPR) repeat protein
MGSEDWYRRTTWTDQDREAFNARLKRSRSDGNKAQYLLIQAACLVQAGYYAPAIELLDRVLIEFPERIFLADTHHLKAVTFVRLGQAENAIEEYRAALAAERNFPGVKTQAWLEFGRFVVESQIAELYDEVSAVLDEFQNSTGLTFPAEAFSYNLIRAFIADARGDHDGARTFATQACEEAAKKHSGFRYHPTVGLVGSEGHRFEAKLKALAEGR